MAIQLSSDPATFTIMRWLEWYCTGGLSNKDFQQFWFSFKAQNT